MITKPNISIDKMALEYPGLEYVNPNDAEMLRLRNL
jgi:hypothetical protein